MPRKTKETVEKELEIEEKVEKKKTSATSKKVSNSSKSEPKVTRKRTATTTTEKKATTKASSAKKKTSTKSTSSEKKANTKTTATKKKATEKKKTSTTSKKKSTTSSRKTKTGAVHHTNKIEIPEYYDLPYHYNQTVVKILAQTPKTLFVYWDVSEKDKKQYEEQFGADFWNNTVPFLRVKNETLHSSFDIEVDDFANGWYIPVEDAKCSYSVELLRKQRPYTTSVIEAPIYITSSNSLETPNDHILFDTNYHSVYFRNIKTNEENTKDMSHVSFLQKVGNIYNIHDFYKRIYKNENIDEIFNLNNPSSGNPTSTFR